jgi:hypothetical protein
VATTERWAVFQALGDTLPAGGFLHSLEILPLITLILTDFTERIGGDFTLLLSEQVSLCNLFKISSISEISGPIFLSW